MPDTNSAAVPSSQPIPTTGSSDRSVETRAAESTIVVADERAMVGLLGSRDALLRQLEQNLAADIHVRGNRITLRGSAADVAFAERTSSANCSRCRNRAR